MKPTLVLAAAILAVTVACGDSPTDPTQTTITVSLASSGAPIFIGNSEVFTVSATQNVNGQAVAVTSATWSSDAPNVATVDSTGRVTGVDSGSATISVEFQARKATKMVRVLPNYGGNWTGSYTVTNCTQTEEFETMPFCGSGGIQIGDILPLSLQFTQAVDILSGTTGLSLLVSDPIGPIAIPGNGQPTVVAVFHSDPVQIDVTWSLSMITAGHVEGTVAQTWTAAGMNGSGTVSGTLSDTTLSQTGRAQAAGSNRPRSLAQALAAIRR
jgi:hypothetical protein